MEMEFGVAPGALPKNLKPGDRVKFEMKAGKPGEFVITKIEPIAAPKPDHACRRREPEGGSAQALRKSPCSPV